MFMGNYCIHFRVMLYLSDRLPGILPLLNALANYTMTKVMRFSESKQEQLKEMSRRTLRGES